MLREERLTDFTGKLAAKVPVPGGGGAAAAVAALAAALGSMTANYTIGKKKYAAYEEELSAHLGETEAISSRLLQLIDEDAAAFEPLSRAYGIPRDDPAREETLEACLRDAAKAPLEIMRLAARVIELTEVLEEKGSVMMRSDVGCAAGFACSALCAAALNVRVNTRLMKDREYAAGLEKEAEALMASRKRAESVYDAVLKKLS